MNTMPDETMLALWLEDELEGKDFAEMEAWAAQHPEKLAMREEVRKWRATMKQAFARQAEALPAPELFAARIGRTIREMEKPERKVRWKFQIVSLLGPLAACACVVLAFWIGTKVGSAPKEIDVTGAPRAIPVEEPIPYTPENGVEAERFVSSEASATVIVLNGLKAIPDDLDLSPAPETASSGENDRHLAASDAGENGKATDGKEMPCL